MPQLCEIQPNSFQEVSLILLAKHFSMIYYEVSHLYDLLQGPLTPKAACTNQKPEDQWSCKRSPDILA